MKERQMFALLQQLWRDSHFSEFYWVALAIVVILMFSRWLSSRLREHEGRNGMPAQSALRALGAGSLKKSIVFPVLALVLVLVLRKVLNVVKLEHLSLLDVAVPLLVAWALARVLIYVLRCVFPEGGFLANAERVIKSSLWGWVALEITGFSGSVIELLETVSFGVGSQSINLWMLMHGAVTVCVTLLVALWVASLIESRLMAAGQMDSNVRELLARLAKAILLVIALLSSLSLVGIDVTTLSVFSGALAVGLGLGLQKIASNYVSGFIILLDRSIRLGNLVAVDEKTSGTVTQITTRYTVLRTRTGIEVIIPNEYLVNNVVRNLSFSDTNVRVELSVQVAYSTDLVKAMKLLVEAAKGHTRVLDSPAPTVLLTGFADSGVNLELRFWVSDPESGTGSIRSDIGLAIWKAFRENGIEIPFPQREIRILGDSVASS